MQGQKPRMTHLSNHVIHSQCFYMDLIQEHAENAEGQDGRKGNDKKYQPMICENQK